ncbi:MAG: GxxExxY protein [Chthoniobacteraceae bacterium]|nr:GxxExxY protein [Chthoniobacteraceae bacterium]
MNSHEGTKARRDTEEISRIVVDCAFHLHKELGPGLLETVYEVVLAKRLEKAGLKVERQKPVPIVVDGIIFNEGFRADLLVNESLLIELKSVETLLPVHSKQLLTYLRLLNLPMGFLINFGGETFKEGVKRVVSGPLALDSSPLRVNRTSLRKGMSV